MKQSRAFIPLGNSLFVVFSCSQALKGPTLVTEEQDFQVGSSNVIFAVQEARLCILLNSCLGFSQTLKWYRTHHR